MNARLGFCFKILYYISSLLPQYIVLILLFVLENLERSGFSPDFYVLLTCRKIIFYLFLILFFVSCICLHFVREKLDEIQDSTDTFGTLKVNLSYNVNPGMGEFLLDILIPIISVFISINAPISSFMMVILIQLLMLVCYFVSSDVFPNVSLLLIHYNVYRIANSDSSNMKYILGKTTRNDDDNNRYSGKRVIVIPLIPDDRNSKFSVIKK